jgi:hypothetical protein
MILYLLYIILIILYVNGNIYLFDNKNKFESIDSNNSNLTLIEFLSQYKTKTKNYNNDPENYNNYISSPTGIVFKDKVRMMYEFPLVNSKHGIFDTFLYPSAISNDIDKFGINTNLVIKNKDGFSINTAITADSFKLLMNNNGWYFNSYQDFGVDYKYLVNSYSEFSKKIALTIYKDLVNLNEDSYFNRVQAALNFIQFLPYGLPEFDSEEWYYFGIATPPESFILGYSDCDSKSIFFASIVIHLIPPENIILVNCTVNSTNESTNGEHMMVAVSNLDINGELIYHNSRNYLLLETTAPIKIGNFEWEAFKTNKIISLV